MAAGLTLDAGALIQLERGDRRGWLGLRLAHSSGVRLLLPAPALAQAWRGPRTARVGIVARWREVVPMDATMARKAGELCGAAGTSDIVDAMVALVASDAGCDVVSTDHADMERLLRTLGARTRILSPSML